MQAGWAPVGLPGSRDSKHPTNINQPCLGYGDINQWIRPLWDFFGIMLNYGDIMVYDAGTNTYSGLRTNGYQRHGFVLFFFVHLYITHMGHMGIQFRDVFFPETKLSPI